MTPPRLSPARIARSLVTVLVLTLIQSVVAPVLNIAVPEARAATLYDNLSNFQQWTTWQGVAANHAPYRTSAGTDVITSNADNINLTQDVGSQTGFLWNTQVFSYTQDLTVSANYYFGAKDGADGIMFSMRPLAQWPNGGTAGSSTGGWTHWASGELRVIFDTYQNGIEIADDHVRVIAVTNAGANTEYNPNGTALKNSGGTTISNVEDNNSYPFTVKWTAASRTIAVYAGLEANHLIYSATVSAAALDATQFSWGWMGYTGGASNYQSVANVTYHVGPTVSTTATDTTVTDGAQVTFTASYTSTESSPTTRWEYSTDGGSTWTSTGTTSTNYTFTATRDFTQRKYRFFVSSTAVGATYTNATTPVTLTVNPPLLGSETDTSLTFTGNASQRAFVASNPTLVIANAITIQAWVKPSGFTVGSWNMVVNKENSYELGITTSNGIPYWTYGINGPGGWQGINTEIVATLDVWHHIAITRAASVNTVNFYLDGYLAYSGTADGAGTSPISDNGSPFTIGARTTDGTTFSSAFKGSIDQVLLFNSARTADEILSDMQSYIDTSTPNLRAFYDFNEGRGTKVYNRVFGTTSTTDLTVEGSPSFDDVKIVDPNSLNTYTTIKFPRSYLTQYGGWKAPAGISRLSYLVVAGGGAGGAGIYSNSDMSGGGGGGGGVRMGTITSPSGYFLPRVGPGQLYSSCKQDRGRNSSFSGLSISTVSATGGGSGGCFNGSIYVSGNTGGSGGGAAAQSSAGQPGSGNLGGYSPAEGFNGGAGQGNGYDGTLQSSGGGGGGAAAAGAAGTATTAGAGGAGIATNYSGSTLLFGSGGGGARRVNGGGGAASNGGGTGGSPSQQGTPGVDGQGGGGGGTTQLKGNSGGFGVIYVRWINASAPSYTKPTNAYLNVGMTETFTTNVAQDSATVTLTRTFKWESTTPSANGVYTVIKQGTGAANASFSWVPSDTSTSGSGYLYRLTVTDSDTAGLFISDSSTAFAIINRALVVSGSSTFAKTINVARSETFTITLGTSTYRPSLSPVIPGITLDTSTAGIAVISIADTVTVGTYYETLTVIDSVSASVVTPLIIKVAAPPNLLYTGEIVADNLVFNLDAGNSASLIADSGTATTGIAWNDLSGSKANAATGAGVNTGATSGSTCTAPTYTSANGGALQFAASSDNCYYASGFTGRSLANNYTVEAWFKTSATLPSGTAIVAQAFPGTNVATSIFIAANPSGNLIVGFYDQVNTADRFANCPFTPVIGAWTHISGTYDGTTLSTYINGTLSCTATQSYTPSGTANTLGMIVGKGKSGATNTSFPGSIATVRMYNKSLTAAQILANFNATKSRFDSSNIAFLNPSKKYGTTLLDSYTVTSGLDTKTVTFSLGDRAGIDWDTATVTNQVKLSVQESLTVGTYYDTITVTDSLGQSTYLPIKFTVTPADTLTVTMGTAATAVYSGSVPTAAPKAAISGLVGVDSATVSTLYAGPIGTGLTCANGGKCVVGDTGPGGGKVFYVSNTIINGVAGISDGGIYLEAAPADWKSGDISQWASVLTDVKGTTSGIGSGALNTKLLIDALGTSATSAKLAADLTYGGKSDWFMGSTAEMQALMNNIAIPGNWAFLPTNRNYFTSTQNASSTSQADNVWSTNASVSGVSKTGNYYMRPIRAFGGTTTPIDVDTYTARGYNLTFSTGYETNYQAIVYETSTLKITQANQKKISINLYGANAGESFTVVVSGGSGTGAITESVTAGGNATGCTVANHILWNSNSKTDQKYCRIIVTKAASRNYFSDSITADVYFMVYINNQPTNQVGSGSTIAINGKTSLTIDDSSTLRVPRITGFTLSGSILTINGEGFGSDPVTITFERYVNASPSPTPTSLGTLITVSVPGGAVSGPVLVITAGGRDSIDWVDLP